MTEFRCYGLIGYAGDRTPEAMDNVPNLTREIASYFCLCHTISGAPKSAKNLPWRNALSQSKPLLELTRNITGAIYADGNFPVLIFARCATAMASLPVVMARHPDAVVVWLDAHGDLNTPTTSETGFLGGMPLAAVLGLWESGFGAGLLCSQLILAGARSLDDAEKNLIHSRDLTVLTLVDKETDLEVLARKTAGRKVFIHLDADVFDPSQVVAEYREPNGFSCEDVAVILATVANQGTLIGIEIAEVSPRNEAERIASHANLIASLTALRPALNPS